MLAQIPKAAFTILLTGTVLFSGCARYSHSARQQRAYAHYVAKMSHNRVKQQTKFKKVKMPKAPAPSGSPAMATSTTTDAPLSVSSNPD